MAPEISLRRLVRWQFWIVFSSLLSSPCSHLLSSLDIPRWLEKVILLSLILSLCWWQTWPWPPNQPHPQHDGTCSPPGMGSALLLPPHTCPVPSQWLSLPEDKIKHFTKHKEFFLGFFVWLGFFNLFFRENRDVSLWDCPKIFQVTLQTKHKPLAWLSARDLTLLSKGLL